MVIDSVNSDDNTSDSKVEDNNSWLELIGTSLFALFFILSDTILWVHLSKFFNNPVTLKFISFISLGCVLLLVVTLILFSYYTYRDMVKVNYCSFNDIYLPNKYVGIEKYCIEYVAKWSDDLKYRILNSDYIETEFELKGGITYSSLSCLKYTIYYSKLSESFFIKNDDVFSKGGYLKVIRNSKKEPKGISISDIFTEEELEYRK